MPDIFRTGFDVPQLRDGVLRELRPGAAEVSQTALRVPSGLRDDNAARRSIMEAVFESLKSQPGFDGTVAGSASFKLRWL
jgi:hypothetical protein